jgi:hypothetical protein
MRASRYSDSSPYPKRRRLFLWKMGIAEPFGHNRLLALVSLFCKVARMRELGEGLYL